jgi:glycosyltransferase involved in cell wall biosynthesis
VTEETEETSPNPVPLVSVAITAFNSAKWLPQALDSVLRQRTDFPIEIVIGDDCSSDETVSVAHSYRERHPSLIRVLERDENVGIQRNYFETFEQCRGKFVAWLDADDYWTDPQKLTLQARVLESDSTVNVCGHFVRWVEHNGEVRRERYPTISAGRYGMAQILRHDFLPSPSVMFRNGIHRRLPPWYFALAPTTDWPIYVLAALSGDIVLLNRVMADYRLTPGSSLASKGALMWYETDARFYEHIEDIIPAKWHRLARAEKGRRYEAMAYALRKQGNFAASREAAWRAFRSPQLMDNVGSKAKALLAAVVREAEWRLKGAKPAGESV